MVKHAEMAMFEAKRQGGDKMVFFDPQLQASIEESSQLEIQLRHAITAGQLELYYQVQLSYNLTPIGAEALIRWNHPARGMVLPGAFIPIAEKSSLIIEIGNWVVDDACRQLSQWKTKEDFKDLTLSINISAEHFCAPEFVERVVNSLKRYDVNPEKLKLEITESIVAADIKTVIERMSSLRKDYRVGLSLDDFGTGYSSLTYLKSLPIHQLKIDQSFIRNLHKSKDNAIMVRAINNLAGYFSLDVIAEGVETEAELAHLRQYACLSYQGYLFSKPLSISKFEALLLNGLNMGSFKDQIQRM